VVLQPWQHNETYYPSRRVTWVARWRVLAKIVDCGEHGKRPTAEKVGKWQRPLRGLRQPGRASADLLYARFRQPRRNPPSSLRNSEDVDRFDALGDMPRAWLSVFNDRTGCLDR
jgi:hypothetical protein